MAQRATKDARPPRSAWSWWWVAVLVWVLGTNLVVQALAPAQAKRNDIPFAPVFLQQVRAGNVAEVSSKGLTVTGTFRRAVRPTDDHVSPTLFRTEIPSYADGAAIERLLDAHGVKRSAEPVSTGTSTWTALLISILPVVIVVGLLAVLMRRAGGAAGGLGPMGFGRSRAKRVEPQTQALRFDDVAGVDEAKVELMQVVDVLRHPDRYRRVGARTPRGVLLTGPPGTGKTFLARAVAGEAGVPFFSIAASEFVELFVGVGASRVRDLFAQAKAEAPAILFIDELDAIGRARGPSSLSGGHEEREQTLNQILAEMDGFDTASGVVVLSATNRPEVLDRALLRPGRFDRQVALEPPDRRGRAAILRVHTRSVPLAPDVDLEEIARATPGMVGADLANLVNEGAIIAARRDGERVGAADLSAALDRLLLGSERHIVMDEADRRRTAYHESGHALIGMLTPGADPVRKISIIPHGKALGITLSEPIVDRLNYGARALYARLDVLQAGQAAEALMCDGEVSTGAENDLREATELARHMAGSWGMSERLGTMTVVHDADQAIAFPQSAAASEDTRRMLDDEVRRILRESRARVDALLSGHQDDLERLAQALLRDETLNADQAYAAAREPMPTVDASAMASS